MSAARNSTATLHISTPEGVVFSLPLAGPVTRAIGFFIDYAVVMAVQNALMFVITPLAIFMQDFGAAAGVLVQFMLTFGYGGFCELLFNGQTLGKRVMRIRVMDERGLRLRPSQVIVRNLVRRGIGTLCCGRRIGVVGIVWTMRELRGELFEQCFLIHTARPP